jgi:hypothetical protein
MVWIPWTADQMNSCSCKNFSKGLVWIISAAVPAEQLFLYKFLEKGFVGIISAAVPSEQLFLYKF